ncbi:hypothetical protein A3D03_06410 [Candidatus Gottesmanbacteria bacterium RIFCSPHIGHO2_02_FULL_40_13]|uniref:Magnesium transport protein CorA n=1 Tax=Candidatus Gottesmanbacteria bacterium RIFCSPHIGHO2_02_FULL_40_13 TaxID=1798384 RepID=A0A1F6A9M6_9BACT|nr:MAG: hypothetical protein A3D03_06410 [Candidatus Gottesmanbacteria bacterium RIFCSPHIGHO2_02_FULL_40_13]
MKHKNNLLDTLVQQTHNLPNRILPLGSKKHNTNKHTKYIRKINYEKTQLIVIDEPRKKDYLYLKRYFRFHPLHLEDILSPIQRPKIDLEDEYIFFVLHFPQFNSQTQKIDSKEIDFFLTENEVIVVINNQFLALDEIITSIFKNKKEREKIMSKGTAVLIYHLFDKLFDSLFPLLEDLEKNLDTIDKNIFTIQPKNIADHISFLRRNVIYCQTLVKPELNAFTGLENTNHKFMTKEIKTYFSNITDHLKKIWDRLEDIKELSDNLSSTFESYLSFKTNETIKFLTIISTILLPLTLLSGIYGMNLSFLPLSNHPNALAIISFIMFLIITLMLLLFKLKRWI